MARMGVVPTAVPGPSSPRGVDATPCGATGVTATAEAAAVDDDDDGVEKSCCCCCCCCCC